ncbi:MAG TPA: hypothetical protein H9837_03260 [Candidatus Brachybacterium merdigallinarum]|nr:hypothetical protein [Candidatus Brachybacterium merdigallinarum]
MSSSSTPRSAPLVQTEGGDCVYDPRVWEADAEAFTAEERSWQPRLAPLNEILAGHGFSEVREFDYVSGEGFGSPSRTLTACSCAC